VRALPGGEIVHVGLEIFDDAVFVCRGEIGAGVGEGECADGGVVCLEDGFEVKCEAVPESEFAACGSGEDSSAFWCPLWSRQLKECVQVNMWRVLR
jgi:hypothetical protein